MNNHDDIKIRASARSLQELITEFSLLLINSNSLLQNFEKEYDSDGNLPGYSQLLNFINILQINNTNVVTCLLDFNEELTLFIRKIDLLKEKIDVFVESEG